MIWKVIRKDYTETTLCAIPSTDGKRHYIRSGKGYIIRNKKGDEGVAGPCCVTKTEYIINSNEKVPDLTLCLKEKSIICNIKLNNNNSNAIEESDKKHIAIAYLMLRVDKLAHYNKLYYKKLNDIYLKYNEGSLADKDIDFILLLSNSYKYPESSFNNLRKIYLYDYYINQYLKYNDAHTYITSVHNYLMEHLRLTDKQINGLITFFTNSKQKFKYSRVLF